MNNFNQFNNQEQMAQFRKSFVTNPSLKWGIILALGILPMIISAILTTNYDLSLGYQWLTAIVLTVIGFIGVVILTKTNKDVKGDVYGSFLGMNFLIINFWLFGIAWWWAIFTAPLMYLLGYLIANFIRFYMFILAARKNYEKLQNGDVSGFTKNMTPQEKLKFDKDLEMFKKMNPEAARKINQNLEIQNSKIKKEPKDKDKNNKDDVIDIKEK